MSSALVENASGVTPGWNRRVINPANAMVNRRKFVRYFKEGPPPELTLLERPEGSHPKLSIVIPTLDGLRGGFLPALLAQLQGQTFQHYEVIVVRGDRRQGRAINTAAAIARGEILVTMDDDTRLGTAELLEHIEGTFAGNPLIGIVGVPNLIPTDVSRIMRRAMEELPRRSSPMVNQITDSDLAEHPCLAIRKDLFYEIGGEHEGIPRGLDPYLRLQVRQHGYRVVVIPRVWIHHLLPPTRRAILKQYFRNGMGAAYVQKFFREFVIDQAERHDQSVSFVTPLSSRLQRYVKRIGIALFSGRWIYLASLCSYAAGYVWGLVRLREDTL